MMADIEQMWLEIALGGLLFFVGVRMLIVWATRGPLQ